MLNLIIINYKVIVYYEIIMRITFMQSVMLAFIPYLHNLK